MSESKQDAFEKVRQTANKIKKEVEDSKRENSTEARSERAKAAAEVFGDDSTNERKEAMTNSLQPSPSPSNELVAQGFDAEVLQVFKEDAEKGMDGIGGTKFPTLRVYVEGWSNSELPDGSKPQDGNFFYDFTQEEMPEVHAHILAVSGGYYAKPYREGNKPVYTQLLSGVMFGDMRPFIMYMSGFHLSFMWEFFGQKVRPFTKGRVPVPMYALQIRMFTKKVANRDGKMINAIHYEVIKNDDGTPVVVNDPELIVALRNYQSQVLDLNKRIVQSRSNDQDQVVVDEVPHPAEESDLPY